MTADRLLKAQSVAELLDLTAKAIYAAAERGEPWIQPAIVRIGPRRIRFKASVIERIVEQGAP